MMLVSEIDLLKGAWLALVQCGVLVRDAVALYEAAAYSSAVALARLSHEELGKSSMLLDLWAQARKTGTLPESKAVAHMLWKHEEKQDRGMMTLPSDPETDALLETVTEGPVDQALTQHQREAWSRLVDISIRTPQDRHDQRVRNLFVDWDDQAGRWQTPSETSASEAYRCLCEALHDYRDAWTDRASKTSAHAFRTLVAVWPDHPTLPRPGRPTPPPGERGSP
jgi:AbiV family abortive infection protein